MMLGKRGRPVQKDHSKGHLMSDSSSDSFFSPRVLVQKARNTSFFTIPGQLVGFSSKSAAPDAADAVRSPTSPLDYKVFSALGSSFLGSPRSSGHDGKPRSWDNSRVGLGLLDALSSETKPFSNKVSSGSSDSSSILLGSQLRINITSPKSQLGVLRNDALGAAPKSLPKDYGISSRPQARPPAPHLGCPKMALGSRGAELGILRSCSADVSGSSLLLTRFTYHDPEPSSEVFSSDLNSTFDSPLSAQGDANFENFSGPLHASAGSAHALVSSLSPTEIEQSEDYTCIISHGPNPKTTRIFGDCILESRSIWSQDFKEEHMKEKSPIWLLKPSEEVPASCALDDFLSFCYSCKRKLEEGKDIYMYRGEKAFCSSECRDQEILIEEELEKPKIVSPGILGSSSDDDMFPEGMVTSL